MNELTIEFLTDDLDAKPAFATQEVSDEALEEAALSLLGPTRPPQCGTSLMCP